MVSHVFGCKDTFFSDTLTTIGEKYVSLHQFIFNYQPTFRTLNKEILRLAIPSIVTNITVPLLGIVDLAIVGHLHDSAAIGAIAVGGLIFNMVYWLFNFLRMGSSGLTAQAYGRRDRASTSRVLRMGLVLAVACGVGIFGIQRLMEWMAHGIIAPSAEVWALAVRYFRVRIWAAPAVLSLFAMNGWLVGMQNTRSPLYIAVSQNLVNIAVSYALVFHAGMSVEGVALGTVVSQYFGLLMAAWLCRRELKLSTAFSTNNVDKPLTESSPQPIVDKSSHYTLTYQQFFTVNRDIFLRMICLIAVTTAFTAYGARMGDTLLAVNTLLMQLFTLFSYFCDGFALAGEALVGKYYGSGQANADDGPKVQRVVTLLFCWGMGVAFAFTLLYIIGGKGILGLLTDDTLVVAGASPYLWWAAAIPLCGMSAFIWDGVFCGLTATRQMFLSLLIGAPVFFVLRWALTQTMADPNDALWLSFLCYLVVRGVVLTIFYHRIKKKAQIYIMPPKNIKCRF